MPPAPVTIPAGGGGAVCSTPGLEYRETNAVGAQAKGDPDQEWTAGAMRFNGDAFSGASKPGGGATFATPPGSVHTSFTLVDPTALNATHPLWFSEGLTQLCWANESLVEYLIAQARAERAFLVRREGVFASVFASQWPRAELGRLMADHLITQQPQNHRIPTTRSRRCTRSSHSRPTRR